MGGLELHGMEDRRRPLPVEQTNPHPARAIVDAHQVGTLSHGSLPSLDASCRGWPGGDLLNSLLRSLRCLERCHGPAPVPSRGRKVVSQRVTIRLSPRQQAVCDELRHAARNPTCSKTPSNDPRTTARRRWPRLVLQPHLSFAAVVVCAPCTGLMASAPS